jgi:hypothetical protein
MLRLGADCAERRCGGRNPGERGVGFVALGDTALALAAVGCTRGMEAVLPRVAEQVRDAIAAPRGRARAHCPEALQARPAARRRLDVQASPLTRTLQPGSSPSEAQHRLRSSCSMRDYTLSHRCLLLCLARQQGPPWSRERAGCASCSSPSARDARRCCVGCELPGRPGHACLAPLTSCLALTR